MYAHEYVDLLARYLIFVFIVIYFVFLFFLALVLHTLIQYQGCLEHPIATVGEEERDMVTAQSPAGRQTTSHTVTHRHTFTPRHTPRGHAN